MNEIEQLLEYTWSLAGKIERPAERSVSYIEIAEVYLESGNKDRCWEVLAEALKTVDALKHPDEKAGQLAWIARLLVKGGDAARARELFTRAILLSRATVTAFQKAGALYRLACEYADAEWNEEASEVLAELYETAIDPENHLDMACELVNIAEIYADIGMTEKAEDTLDDVIEIATALKDNWFKAERMIEAAEIYSKMEAGDKAVQILNTTGPIVECIDETNRLGFLFKMVDIYTMTGQKSKALDTLTGALLIIDRNTESPSRVQDLIDISEDYWQLGDKEAAGYVLIQAKRLIEGVEEVKEKISGLISLSSVFHKMDRVDQGLDIANQALALCGTLQDKKTVPFMMGKIAVLYAELKDRNQAAKMVSGIKQYIKETPLKTSGLGAIVNELAESGESVLALNLAKIISGPDIKASVLISIVQSLIEANREPDQTRDAIQNIVEVN